MRTGRNLFAAANAKAADQTRLHAQPPQQVIRQFVYDRLLARLFHDPNAPWLLKGGNALMSREPVAARASLALDIAAHRAEEDRDELLRRFEAAAEMDLGDHFRFEITSRREHHQGSAQPYVGLARNTPGCANRFAFEPAVGLARDAILDLVFTGNTTQTTWNPSRQA